MVSLKKMIVPAVLALGCVVALGADREPHPFVGRIEKLDPAFDAVLAPDARSARDPRGHFLQPFKLAAVRYAAACTCAFVAFDKVLSPQYLLWLIPLVPLVRGRRGLLATGLLAAALVLTQVWFPQRYFDYALHFRLAGVVLARDLVLVALVAVLALPARLAQAS